MTLTGKRLEFPSPPRRKGPLGAWPVFEKKLAETLGALEEDQYLVVSAKRGWAYVQFAAQGSFGLRAECVGNNYLDEAHALSAGQTALLRKIGWSSPTGTRGSPNFFRDFDRPVPCADAARMAVRALTEVFEIPHPRYLEYKAFDKKDRTILVPTLGLKRAEPAPPPEKPRANTVKGLRKLVLNAIRKASGDAKIELDGEEDVPLRFGTESVFVRVFGDPLRIGVFSPILADVELDAALVGRINELNASIFHARLFAVEGTVFAAAEVFATPFVAEHVTSACWGLGDLVNDVGKKLREEFGERRAPEGPPEGPAVQ